MARITLAQVLLLLVSLHTTSAHLKYLHPHEVIEYVRSQQALIEHSCNNSHYLELSSAIQQLLSNPDQLYHAARYEANGLSEQCSNQTMYMLESMLNLELWALKMADAAAKPVPGIILGGINWLGEFDECVAVQSNGSNTLPAHYQFSGKYCTIGSSFPPAGLQFGNPRAPSLKFGVCMPDGCTEEEITTMVKWAVDRIKPGLFNGTTECQQKNVPFTAGAIATIVVYSIMGAICVVGTIFDYFTQCTQVVEEADSPLLVNETEENGDVSLINRTSFKPAPKQHGIIGRFLLCFSFHTNGSKILSGEKTSGSLGCLHGIRFISLNWVILGHVIGFSVQVIGNPATILTWINTWSFEVIINATVSVDSFFMISGLLAVYMMLKTFERTQPSVGSFLKSVPIIYLHRFLRLTPAYGFMILFYNNLLFYTSEGPLKANSTYADPNCNNNSWAALLYINNIYDDKHMCAGWGWYLANDFQFFLVTPFIAYLAHKWDVLGYVTAGVLTNISIITAIVISVYYDVSMTVFLPRDPALPIDIGAAMRLYYFKPWTRFQSFGVGCCFAILLYKGKTIMKRLPTIVNLLLWALAGFTMLIYLYGPYHAVRGDRIATKGETAIYTGFGRSAWCIALGYIILACCTGRGGFVNEFLSWSGFIPLSRMTYCAYLLHPIVILGLVSAQKQIDTWTYSAYASQFSAVVTLSYMAAFSFSLLFEAPFLNLDKNYITGRFNRN